MPGWTVFNANGAIKHTSAVITLSSSADVTGVLPAANIATAVTVTTTGNIDDLDFSNAAQIRMNNATLSTIRGLKAGTAGQLVTIVSVGAGQVNFAHQNTGSTSNNRLINLATSVDTPLAAGTGVATFQYDGTTLKWRLVDHQQGAFITQTFSAGDFTGNNLMTWTVIAGNVTTFRYLIVGRLLYIMLFVTNSTIGGTPSSTLIVALPNGAVPVNTSYHPYQSVDVAMVPTSNSSIVQVDAGVSNIKCFYDVSATNWALTANAQVRLSLAVEIT